MRGSTWFRRIAQPKGDGVTLLEPWKPTIPRDINGWVTEHTNESILHACEHLNVAMIAAPTLGYIQKSIGVAVAAADGTRSWIKVTGRYDSLEDPHRAHEIEAGSLVGLPKPEVMAHFDWTSGGIHWRALHMTLAPAPVVEVTPWSGPSAHTMRNGWISQLREAIGVLSKTRCDRFAFQPADLNAVIRSQFGDNAPTVADEWRVAFCDMHWANVTAPQLMLLDWELWGLAPRGYDGAMIVSFSAADPPLMQRLQSAFADDLQTPSGRVAQLAVYARILIGIEMDLFHPGLREPIMRLARQSIE